MLKKVVYLKQQNTRHKQPCFLTSQRNLQKMASETAKFSKELLTTNEQFNCKTIEKKSIKQSKKMPKSRQEVHSLPLEE